MENNKEKEKNLYMPAMMIQNCQYTIDINVNSFYVIAP